MNAILQALPPPTSFWPTTLVGYLTAGVAFFGILGALWAYAKFMAHLNGLGERVNRAEIDLEKVKTQLSDFGKAADKLIEHHRILTEQIANSVSKSDRIHDENVDMRLDVAGFLAEMKTEMTRAIGELNKTIAGLQSDVRHLGRHQ
jgi:uncharacterized protein YoxC